jgi:hypothetical protein
VFDNAMLYNESEDHEVHQAAKALKLLFDRKLAKAFPDKDRPVRLCFSRPPFS